MCLIAWAVAPATATPLWVAANRDEQWDRPTLPFQAWPLPDGTTVWSGRDVLAGGTWLAFGARGRVAMLTNVRAWPPEPPRARSRGALVTAWLAEDAPATWTAFARQHAAAEYNGCNLVLGDVLHGQWAWITNRDPAHHQGADAASDTPLEHVGGWWGRALPPGRYALSNAALDTPWPKVRRLKTALSTALAAADHPSADDALLRALQTHLPHPDARQHVEASPFVHLPSRRYGTRSSLIARWDRHGTLTVAEWTYDSPSGPAAIESAVQRRISIDWWGMPTSS
ncbi:NRDE family protein [Tepidimonas taiwanensis]|uniref:Transport and Golgi organization 2 n=1 Tax=Tepidimonas taiwanensis TaxID=307486 RepID=A0A554X9Q4_9BURK|nr:NRDE family protein [Tepidimonas taiwanensis]MCX7693415.1 NRDE family protein [Tepidimonas taiwanensis]TSE32516.1 Transport and Golgi organization 2 [Tepidimonas taiwanensis]UBQ06490.1 NRDE family protein [Tepidimonas taiwanensis]